STIKRVDYWHCRRVEVIESPSALPTVSAPGNAPTRTRPGRLPEASCVQFGPAAPENGPELTFGPGTSPASMSVACAVPVVTTIVFGGVGGAVSSRVHEIGRAAC